MNTRIIASILLFTLCIFAVHHGAGPVFPDIAAGEWGEAGDGWNGDDWTDDEWEEGGAPAYTPPNTGSGGMMSGLQSRPPRDRAAERPADTSGGGRATGRHAMKAVWLHDTTLGMPFCRLMIPEHWTAEGNVYWNPNTPMAPFSVWARLHDPDTDTTIEILNPIGEFTWNEMKASVTRCRVTDGIYELDTGVYNLKYRNAQALLQEFLLPAVLRMTPGARVMGGIHPNPTEEDRLRREVQQLAAQAARYVQVRGSEGTSAYAIVEHDGKETMIGCGSMGFYSTTSVPYMGTFNIYVWKWANIYTVTVPKGGRPTFDPVQKYTFDHCVFNPQWLNAVGQFVARLQQQRSRTIVVINEQARAAMRRSGDVLSQNADRWSRYILDQSIWADPEGQTYLGPNTGTYGYINGFGDTLVLSDTEILGANLNNLKPLTRVD